MRVAVTLMAVLGVLTSCTDRGSPVGEEGPQGPLRVQATWPPDGARGPFPDLFSYGDGEDAPHMIIRFSRPVRISAFAPGMVTIAGFSGDVLVRAVAAPGKEGEEQDVSRDVAVQLLIPNLLFPQWYEIGRSYEVLVDTTVRSVEGLPLESPYRFSFLPEPSLRVSRFTPEGGAAAEPFPVSPSVQFNGVVTAGALEKIRLAPAAPGTWVNVSFGDLPSFFIFTGTTEIRSGTMYTITVEPGVRDTQGYTMAAGDGVSFTTARFAIGDVVPAPGATRIPVETTIAAPCGWPVDLPTLDSGVTITPPLAGRWISESNPERFVFLPEDDLEEGTVYTVRIGTGVQAIDGTPLAAPFEWRFTTAAGEVASRRSSL